MKKKRALRYTRPTFEEFVEYVKNHDKRVGLRMIYHTYKVPKYMWEKYRIMWREIEKSIKDVPQEQEEGTEIEEAVEPEPVPVET